MDKSQLFSACREYLRRKMVEFETAIDDANKSIQEDTKSSAGDKYETSREMIQQDLNRLQQQLDLAHQDLAVLSKIENLSSASHVHHGSVVKTDSACFFIAISIGVLRVAGEDIFVISPQSPIGQQLIGKSVDDVFIFNGKTYRIEGLN